MIETLRKLDKSNMMEVTLDMPNQILDAIKVSEEYNQGDIPLDRSRIHLFGIGGSAIAGDLLRDMLSPEKKIIIHRGTLPPRDKRGVIISSYSGDTTEIVDEAHRLIGGLKSNIFISSGGLLSDLAMHWSIPLWKMPGGYQPRAAIGWSLGLIMSAMVKWRIVRESVRNKLADSAARLSASIGQGKPADHPLIKAAKPIAKELTKKNCIVLHSLKCTGAARRLASQINENAKHPAFAVLMPEGLHNAIEGIAGGDPKTSALVYLSDPDDPPYLRDGLEKSAEIFTEQGYKTFKFPSIGNDQFDMTLSRLLVADFVSLFLSAYKKLDPTPIPMISRLKAELKPDQMEDVEEEQDSEFDEITAPE